MRLKIVKNGLGQFAVMSCERLPRTGTDYWKLLHGWVTYDDCQKYVANKKLAIEHARLMNILTDVEEFEII